MPTAHEIGVFDRALKFLMNVQHGQPYRRFNWTMTVDPLLDTSPESYHEWGPSRATLTPENIGRRMHLRVELRSFWRLPRSNAPAFPIQAYLCSFEDLVSIPKWGRRFHRIIRDLPEPLAVYNGFARKRPLMVDWLSRYHDSAPTSPGIWPD